MTIYSPLAFIFAVFLPLIVILYLLKQQHQDYPVSSIMLWQQALKDIEANAPWQKLRNNLLMLLQLLLMSLLIFALAKPFIQTEGTLSRHLILVLDVSASMQAEDTSPSRFESAKKELLKVIGNSSPNTQFTVISMGPKTKIELNGSMDKGTVMEIVKKIALTNGAANIQEAKTIIQSIKHESQNAQVIFLGDNNYKIFEDAQFVNVAGNNENAAVLLLSYTQQGDKIIVLSKIANYSSKEKNLSLSLYGDEEVLDAKDISLDAGETKDIYWNTVPSDVTLLACEIEDKDDINNDNIGRTVIAKEKERKVLLVTEKNVFLEKALLLIPGIELFKTNHGNANISDGYDVYIYDGYIPIELPTDGNILIFNPTPENPWVIVQDGDVEISSVDQSAHFLMEHIQDYKFSIGAARDIKVPEWGEIVLSSGEMPLIVAGQKGTQKIIAVGFDLHHSDLPLKSAFPIMINNFMEWLAPSAMQKIGSLHPYEAAEFNVNPEVEQINVISPSGKRSKAAPPFPVIPFEQTDEIGFYTVEYTSQNQNKYDFFAVNYPVSSESMLVHQSGNDEASINIEDRNNKLEIGYNLTWIFILLAFMVLCVEWWVYNYGN
ncbi:BatA and WFA domain-containing protein [Petroclostridium sp. X23]|uniref:vWA domain-containing protein n=1 Tax=Petroclostridium sp. X23 TaxID=3045146 RepID=UPI0024ADAA0B|nr:BatA and WFA domain-containing protein [Petroclostridium sp. X23]WHH59612.1 BatA and WFA domain-containing protein [Petroclostridium sp. X23]